MGRRKIDRTPSPAATAVRGDVPCHRSTGPRRLGVGTRGLDPEGMAKMRAAQGRTPASPQPASATPTAPPAGAETQPPADPQLLLRAMPSRFLGVKTAATVGASPASSTPDSTEPADTFAPWGAPKPVEHHRGRLPGGLRYSVAVLAGAPPRGPATAPRETQPEAPTLAPRYRVAVLLRTPFGSAMTPFGGDGPALAGTLGAGADPWNLLRVRVERDAATAWEVADTDGAGFEATVARLATALTWRLLRADVRGGDAAGLDTARGTASHHHRGLGGATAMALRASVLLMQRPPFEFLQGGDHPDFAAWVRACANRATYGHGPAGALWPVARTGLWRDANNLACHSLMPRLRELREDAFTQAAELCVVVQPEAPAPPVAPLATPATPSMVPFALGLAALEALRGHPLARLDFRRPSASLTARTRAACGDLPGYRWPTFPGFDAPSVPTDLPCRPDDGAVLPFDADGFTAAEDTNTVTVPNPALVRATALAPEALDAVRSGTGTMVALALHPFTYVADTPEVLTATRALDAAMARARAANVVRGVGSRGHRPDAFEAHREAIEAILTTPTRLVRAVPRDPGACESILADVAAVFAGLAAWARDQHLAVHAGRVSAGIGHLSACLAAEDTPVAYTFHGGRHIGTRKPLAARGRVRWDGPVLPATARLVAHPEEVVAATHATAALLRAGECFARFGLPRVTVEYRAAVGVPCGLPTLTVWLPIPARDVSARGALRGIPRVGARDLPWSAAIAEALALVWEATLVGPGLLWGPEAYGAALAALAAPAPTPASVDPVDVAHDTAMALLRGRVARCGAHDGVGATPPVLPPALGDAQPPDPFAGLGCGRLRGTSMAACEERLHVARAALWPLAPGILPRRVVDAAPMYPVPLPVVVAPGGRDGVYEPSARSCIARPFREALYLMGYLRPAAWRGVETTLPGSVPSPWDGAIGTTPEVLPDARAVPSEGRGAALARDGTMRAEGDDRRVLNRMGAALVRRAALAPEWRATALKPLEF